MEDQQERSLDLHTDQSPPMLQAENVNLSAELSTIKTTLEHLQKTVEILITKISTKDKHITSVEWPVNVKKNRFIYDIVHGNIVIFHPLQKIVDTKEFQRLRNLKQLGLAHMVFPSAVHTRFAHSIGTFWMAHQVMEHLRKHQGEDLEITAEDHLCVCIAALCHDIGHGPLSHLFDQPYRAMMAKRLSEENRTKALEHEEVSKILIRNLMKEMRKHFEPYLGEGQRYKDNVNFIVELVDGQTFNEKKEWVPKGRPMEKSFLFDIVSNKHDGFDVDKYDYLLRDSLHSGVAIALNNASIWRIISHAKVLEHSEVNGNVKRICYAKKVADTLQQVGIARQLLHGTLYQHKTKEIIEHLVVKAMVRATPDLEYTGVGGVKYNLSRVTENMEAFLKTTDYVLQEISRSPNAEASSILENVDKRKNHKRIDEVLYDPAKADSKSLEETFINELGGLYEENKVVLLTRDMNRGRKDKEPMSEVLLFDHNDQLVEMKPKKADSEWLRLKSSSAKVLETGLYVDRDYNTEKQEEIKKVFDTLLKKLDMRTSSQKE